MWDGKHAHAGVREVPCSMGTWFGKTSWPITQQPQGEQSRLSETHPMTWHCAGTHGFQPWLGKWTSPGLRHRVDVSGEPQLQNGHRAHPSTLLNVWPRANYLSSPWFLLWFHGDSHYPYFTKSLWVLNKTQDSAWPMVNVPKWTLIFFLMLCFFGGDDSLLCTEWTQSGALWGREWGHQTRGKASERPQAPLLPWTPSGQKLLVTLSETVYQGWWLIASLSPWKMLGY